MKCELSDTAKNVVIVLLTMVVVGIGYLQQQTINRLSDVHQVVDKPKFDELQLKLELAQKNCPIGGEEFPVETKDLPTGE